MNESFKTNDRWEQIVALVDENSYLSVKQLSVMCNASDITIRRDLEKLDKQKRVRRTHGGVVSLSTLGKLNPFSETSEAGRSDASLFDRLDVLVTADILPRFASLLQKTRGKQRIPVIAESLPLPDTETCVTVDNYQAGFELGQWAGRYAEEHWQGNAQVLDLTYHRPNTLARSHGFIAGLHDILPSAALMLSINTQSRYDMAYQLTRDAFTVHPKINIIFAINDVSALGAIHACRDLALDLSQIIILPFGIEGQKMIEMVMEGGYIAAAVCMFPEIVGAVCIEAAIAAYNNRPLPLQLITPYCVVTRETLPEYYEKTAAGWRLK